MTVTLVEELGPDTYVYGIFHESDGTNVDLVVRGQGIESPKVGTVVRVKPTRTYIFDSEGDQLRLS